MRKSHRPLIVVSRTSRLARAQTRLVAEWLLRHDPELKIEHRWIESEADQNPDLPLSQAGGKGMFVRSLEKLLLEGQADLAVHSLKDLPVLSPPGLTIAAVPPRAETWDVLISAAGYPGLAALPPGASVGTASARRKAQLLRQRADLQIQLLRGNLDRRLRIALEEKQVDAIVLAQAGLRRLEMEIPGAAALPIQEMLPPAAQGAMALQCRAGDHVTLRRCLPINDAISAALVHAERQVVAGLGGDCHAPMGVLGEWIPVDQVHQLPPARYLSDRPVSRQDRHQPHLRLRARVLSHDGRQMVEVDDHAPVRHATKFVKHLLRILRDAGAAALVKGQA